MTAIVVVILTDLAQQSVIVKGQRATYCVSFIALFGRDNYQLSLEDVVAPSLLV